jgi:hypothetical protein
MLNLQQIQKAKPIAVTITNLQKLVPSGDDGTDIIVFHSFAKF